MSDKWRHKSLMMLRNIGYMQFLAHEEGGAENAKTKHFSKPE